MFHPREAALGSLLRALPCLAGLVLILLNRAPAAWWWVVLLWSLAAATGGKPVAMVLLPGLVIAAIFAWRSGGSRGR